MVRKKTIDDHNRKLDARAMINELEIALKKYGGPSGLAPRLIDDEGRAATAAAVSMWLLRSKVPYRWRGALRDVLRARRQRRENAA